MESKNSKVCSNCKIEKDLCEFNKLSKSKDGRHPYCKECRKSQTKKYRELNREKLLKSSSNYRKNNPLKVKENKKRYHLKNIDKIKEKLRQYQLNNKDKRRTYKEKNKDKLKEKRLEWIKNNTNKIREWENEYHRKRYNDDILYRLSKNVRGRLRSFIKRNKITKKDKTFDIVGCSPEFLREYLENQFTNGMSWDNQGFYGWHIDHIIPLSSAKTEEDLYKLSHYTNLQPLWGKDNMIKGNRISKSSTNNPL
jgi:hypothetical protein